MSAIHVSNQLHLLRPTPGATLRTITITSTAGTLEARGSFTLSVDTKSVLLYVAGGVVNTDPTGGTPTTSVGVPLAVGQMIQISAHEAKIGKWILATATAATLTLVEYTH